jgi:hypothetical protein
MSFSWRDLEEKDLLDCLNLDPRYIGDELVGRQRAIAIWRKMLGKPYFGGRVFEFDPPIGGRRIAGFGASVFVSEAFVTKEIAHPRPGLRARVIQSVDSALPVVLTPAQIRADKTRGGLNLVVLCDSYPGGLDQEQLLEFKVQFAEGFVDFYKGYRFRRLLYESMNPEQKRYAEAIPGWRIVVEFDDGLPGRAIAVMHREIARWIPGTAGPSCLATLQSQAGLRRKGTANSSFACGPESNGPATCSKTADVRAVD